MTSTRLLQLLADGEFHSGAALAETLGVSRTAVWKQIANIEALGLEVEARHGRGYRLTESLDLLEADTILALGGTPLAPLTELTVVLESGSTNDDMSARAMTGDVHARALLAERQTAGRGRLGRPWVSPFGRNLYLTLGWRFAGGVRGLQGLSLAVGCAIAEAIDEQFGVSMALKWPNDLYIDGRKCGGVLIDMSGDPSGECVAIIGVGLNVAMSGGGTGVGARGVEVTIDQPWTDLSGHAREPVTRNEAAASVLSALVPLLQGFETEGFAHWRDRWQARDMLRGSPVEVSGTVPVSGLGAGVNESGALLVAGEENVEVVYGGDATLRKAGPGAA